MQVTDQGSGQLREELYEAYPLSALRNHVTQSNEPENLRHGADELNLLMHLPSTDVDQSYTFPLILSCYTAAIYPFLSPYPLYPLLTGMQEIVALDCEMVVVRRQPKPALALARYVFSVCSIRPLG